MQHHKDDVACDEFDPVGFVRVVGKRQWPSDDQQKSAGEAFHRPALILINCLGRAAIRSILWLDIDAVAVRPLIGIRQAIIVQMAARLFADSKEQCVKLLPGY